jgi:transposase
MSGNASKRYPPELRKRAVRMVAEVRADHESEWAAIGRVAQLLGVTSAETVRQWVRRAEVDAGDRPGVTSEESAEVRRLKRENAELKHANAILKAGGCRTNRRRIGGASRAVCRWCRDAGALRWSGESVELEQVVGRADQLPFAVDRG